MDVSYHDHFYFIFVCTVQVSTTGLHGGAMSWVGCRNWEDPGGGRMVKGECKAGESNVLYAQYLCSPI